ncbi:hypothetical protein B0T16DRAFT_168671 [Cercophora newfieldiana]|uniref:Ricin B lectin domain-containing protein n=1 Tax=Cercophora newfieldiana TaxID=92897 RepID=A0AA40CPN6_9PEZI|nr:hypothetical protein B0T16DRAFT_168671 [Cercophora newfieldiana]
MHTTLSFLLGWVAVASAGSFRPRAVNSLDEAATAEAHRRDNGATRAFSNVQIKTSDGKCLFVDKLSGDFRANLTPVQVAACGSTDGQGWDIITQGTHISGNNVMLVVSTLTQACLNFDGRRAAGNQVLLFSCGGRADGGGAVTDSQIFAFDGSAGPLTLKPRNQAGSCLTVKGNALDIAACASGNAAQSFTLGGPVAGGDSSNANTGTTASGEAIESSRSNPEATSTRCAGRTRTVTARGQKATTESLKITLKAKGSKTRKTRASAAPTIVAPNDLGAAAPSNTVTKEAVPSASTIEPAESSEVIVSSEAAESVATTSANTAAAGATPPVGTTKSGKLTRSGKRFRPKTTKATKTTGVAQATDTAQATDNAETTNTNTDASSAISSSAPASAFTSSTPPAANTDSANASSASSASSSSPATTPSADGNGGIPTANPTTPVPVSRAGGTLNPSAAAEAHKRDATATRTFANVEIRAPNGQCLSVDPTAGDFRQNLIPVAMVACSGAPNEKWDVIERGVHNQPGRIPAAIVVSALMQGCVSFDGRRGAGDTVTVFSCGGRADGSGGTNSGQQFPFIGQLSFAFAPLSEGNRTCVLDGTDGRLTSGPCPTDGAQLFSVFP